MECGLLRRVSGLELGKAKLTFLYFSGFGGTQNEQSLIGVTARSIWELLAWPFGLRIIPHELLLFVNSLICSSVFWMFWLKAFQPLLCTPHVHLIPMVIQYPRGVWVTSGMWDCFLFPDWRVGTFTGQNTTFVIDGKQISERNSNKHSSGWTLAGARVWAKTDESDRIPVGFFQDINEKVWTCSLSSLQE